MTDKNGKTLHAGARVRFTTDSSSECMEGTVRRIRETSYYNCLEQRDDVLEARVDDGDPNNIDEDTNGFTVILWLESANIELL